jgi:hypothetical protein
VVGMADGVKTGRHRLTSLSGYFSAEIASAPVGPLYESYLESSLRTSGTNSIGISIHV